MILTVHLLNNIITPDNSGVMCAIAPLVGAAIIGGAASLINGIFNRNSQETYNDRMIRMQQETNDLNYKINQENNAYNRQLAIDMFNMENVYNNPAAQMTRLANAGINPYVAAGQVGQVEGRADTIAAQNPIPMSGPSGLGTQAPQLDITSPLQDVAQAFASLAQAKKTGVETDQLEAMFNDIVREKKAQADLVEATARMAEMDKIFKALYGLKKANFEVKNLEATYNKLQAETDYNKAQKLLADFQLDWNKVKKQLDDKELARISAIEPYFNELASLEVSNKRKEGVVLDTQATANRAAARASDAAARESNARTETENQLRQWKVQYQQFLATQKEYESGLTITDWNKAQNTYKEAVERVGLENELTRRTVELVNEQINKAILEQDWYVVFGLMNSAAGMLNALKK